MTRLLILSDLHHEQRSAWSLPEALPAFDVAIFAGDVDGSPERAVRRLAMTPGIAGRPAVFVPGNHEYYGGVLQERLSAGRAACAGTRVHFLAPGMVVLADVRFVGATLWTDYGLFGDRVAAMDACRNGMADHHHISIGPPGARRRFMPEDAAGLHVDDRSFIEAELARPFAGRTVVVTHHAPHPGSVAPCWARDPLTPGFVSDLEGLVLRGRPDLWVHGHVHESYDYRVGGTRVLANPKGYGPRTAGAPAENSAFDPGLVIELATAGQTGRGDDGPAPPSGGPGPITVPVARWTLVRVKATGDLHILGYRAKGGRGRASSPVRAFDRATRTASTMSGDLYVLVGDASGDGLDDQIVLAWMARRDLAPRDVEAVQPDDL